MPDWQALQHGCRYDHYLLAIIYCIIPFTVATFQSICSNSLYNPPEPLSHSASFLGAVPFCPFVIHCLGKTSARRKVFSTIFLFRSRAFSGRPLSLSSLPSFLFSSPFSYSPLFVRCLCGCYPKPHYQADGLPASSHVLNCPSKHRDTLRTYRWIAPVRIAVRGS